MRIAVLCLMLVTGAPLVATAQQEPSPLLPDARPGDRLTVTTGSGATFRGRLLEQTADAVVLRSDGRERAIARGEIERVTERRNRFLLGPLIGLAAGLAAGMPLKTRFDNEAANGDALLALCVGLGVATGVVIDLTNGTDRTIYSRRTVSRLQLHPARRGAGLRWTLEW
jgi:hypothetical protein